MSAHTQKSPAGVTGSGDEGEPSPAVASPAGDMRAAIMAAAARLFAERGYNATSVRAVVEHAGCKKPTLYYYFANKEHLFLEVIESSCAQLNALVESALATEGNVRQRLHRALSAYLAHVREDPTLLRLLMTAERHPEQGQPFFDFDALRQHHVEGLRAIFEEGVQRGELRADLDMEEAVLALFAIIDHRLVLSLHGRPLPGDLPARLLDLFFHGVGA
ncbi:MAG: TetR/AcrR family transcriptional regulator [Myxococcales bacterium]|jgi:AcrR family transcriptional regulator